MLDLIPLPVRIGLLLAVIAGAGVACWTWRGAIADRDIAEIHLSIEKERADSFKAGQDIERKQQEVVNEALRKQNEKLAGINSRLAADLDRLRQRPERPAGVSEAPRAACEGANGAELGGSHAGFLARFAAASAKQDAALATCYAVLDAVR